MLFIIHYMSILLRNILIVTISIICFIYLVSNTSLMEFSDIDVVVAALISIGVGCIIGPFHVYLLCPYRLKEIWTKIQYKKGR